MHDFDDDDDDDLLEHRFDEEEAHRHMFRCTYCEALIPRLIEPHELGLTSHDQVEQGAQYPYTGCWCGWGKFVICER
jgi:hypothetical protein